MNCWFSLVVSFIMLSIFLLRVPPIFTDSGVRVLFLWEYAGVGGGA